MARGYLRQLDDKGTRWQAIVYVRGTRADGKRREYRVIRVFRGTKREAEQQLAQLRQARCWLEAQDRPLCAG